MLITDGGLETVVEGPEIVVHHGDDVLARMNAWCVEHHGASGLTVAVAESAVTMREAELQVLEFVRRHVKPKEGLVAGSTVHVDLSFLKVRLAATRVPRSPPSAASWCPLQPPRARGWGACVERRRTCRS